MITDLDNTETVVRRHLKAFLDQRGIAAIVNDYADDACFLTEERTYRGKRAIGTFFEAFIAALPPQAIGRFALRTLRAEGEM